jgi:peptidoglycan/xylan/chitin deacetylase (PgdA/CDA1 family)
VKEGHLKVIGDALRWTGVGALTRASQPRDNTRIALTHYVPDRCLENFKRIVEHSLQLRQAITPADLLDHYGPNRSPSHGKLIAFTFDDGLLSSYRAAQEVLNPLGIRAAFFIPTAIFDLRTNDEMRDFFVRNVYRKPAAALTEDRYLTMTEAHVRELHAQGHAIYPHTHSHLSVAEITTGPVADRELRAPKALLEDLLQSPARAFAPPFGTERAVGPEGFRVIRETFDLCLTGLNGINTSSTDCYQLRRDCIHAHFPARHVDNILMGVYDVPYGVKRRRLNRHASPA